VQPYASRVSNLSNLFALCLVMVEALGMLAVARMRLETSGRSVAASLRVAMGAGTMLFAVGVIVIVALEGGSFVTWLRDLMRQFVLLCTRRRNDTTSSCHGKGDPHGVLKPER